MSDDLMLKCLIAFILGWLLSRMMGDGFSVGGWSDKMWKLFEQQCKYFEGPDCYRDRNMSDSCWKAYNCCTHAGCYDSEGKDHMIE